MKHNDPELQSLGAKRAESQRPHHGTEILRDTTVSNMHRARAETALRDLSQLQRGGVSIDPFLEIGAGSGQRSGAVLNSGKVDGVATDISLPSLQDGPYVTALLQYARVPTRICCDAHHLPFLPNTFALVFAYQSLHHFPNPTPVIAECYRVLGRGGHFFFNEEPMDSRYRRLLRGSRILSHPPSGLQRMACRLGVERIFWDDGAWERSLGITEARFDLNLWREALSPFVVLDVEVNRKLRLNSDLRKPVAAAALSGIVGGNVKGVCLKATGEAVTGGFRDRLLCLDCGGPVSMPQEPNSDLACPSCSRAYPIVDGVLRMLPANLEAALYAPTSSQHVESQSPSAAPC